MLGNEAKPTILTKRYGLLRKGVLYLQNKICLHTAHLMLKIGEKLDRDILSHLLYRPGPVNFFLLLKKFLYVRVKTSVENWLRLQDKILY